MLKTRYFEFNRHGQLTIFAERISHANLIRILKLCVLFARRKHTRKPAEFRFVPTLTEVA